MFEEADSNLETARSAQASAKVALSILDLNDELIRALRGQTTITAEELTTLEAEQRKNRQQIETQLLRVTAAVEKAETQLQRARGSST